MVVVVVVVVVAVVVVLLLPPWLPVQRQCLVGYACNAVAVTPLQKEWATKSFCLRMLVTVELGSVASNVMRNQMSLQTS